MNGHLNLQKNEEKWRTRQIKVKVSVESERDACGRVRAVRAECADPEVRGCHVHARRLAKTDEQFSQLTSRDNVGLHLVFSSLLRCMLGRGP